LDIRSPAVPNHNIYHDFLEYVQMFCTNIGKVERTEKTANMSDERKLQPFLTGRGQEINSWIWWWGCAWWWWWWWRDNDDGKGT